MVPDKPEYARGTTVGVRIDDRVRAATVIEDRGVFVGHRILRIRLGDLNDLDAREWEIAADELEPLPAAAREVGGIVKPALRQSR